MPSMHVDPWQGVWTQGAELDAPDWVAPVVAAMEIEYAAHPGDWMLEHAALAHEVEASLLHARIDMNAVRFRRIENDWQALLFYEERLAPLYDDLTTEAVLLDSRARTVGTGARVIRVLGPATTAADFVHSVYAAANNGGDPAGAGFSSVWASSGGGLGFTFGATTCAPFGPLAAGLCGVGGGVAGSILASQSADDVYGGLTGRWVSGVTRSMHGGG